MKRAAPSSQQGYVLLLVLGLLALGSFVAMRFAERNDALRRNVLGFTEYAEGQRKAASALASTQYWMVTRNLHPMGHTDGPAESPRVLHEDGRWYAMPDGGMVSVQDHRGLLSINALDRGALVQLLVGDGLEPRAAQAWLDVLQDYQDPDHLHRLNGAERDEYARLGLPPPRNDWLMSLRELESLPRWRDDPARVARVQRLLHTAISNQFNPNTASPTMLRARIPTISDAQLAALEALRRGEPIRDVRRLNAAIGLKLDEDSTIPYPGFTSRITVWAPGMPQALDYNFRLTPAGQDGPWVLLEHQPAPRPPPLNERNRAAFPLDPTLAPGQPARAAAP